MNRKILPVIAIVGDIEVAKELSERFAGQKGYFAIMEEPWTSRPDAEHEVIRRNNLLAIIPHEHLAIAGCSKKSYELLMKVFPRKYKEKIIEVKDKEKIYENLRLIPTYSRKSRIKKQHVEYVELKDLSGGEKIAVIENSNSIGQIIAENFCVANEYKVLKIEGTSEQLGDECEDLMRDWNCSGSHLVRHEAKEKLFKLLRNRIGDLEQKRFHRIVFFTRGIPYGILPFKSPVAHLFLERDLGLQILRGYASDFEENPGLAIALICDPEKTPDSETTKIKEIMIENGVEIVDLMGKKATSYSFMHLIERYPYDFAMISSHAGEVDGQRITEEYISPRGVSYKVVYDLYTSFAPVPGNDTVIVQELTVPILINQIPWSDKERIRREVDASDLRDFLLKDRKNRKGKLLKKEERKGIKFSNALQFHHLTWIPIFHTLGETRFPVIFNNACSSWIEMANKFIFAGALAYIGTTKDINNILASTCGSRFIELATKKRSMLYALFQAQEPYIDQLGYSPYLYFGHPDASLQPTFSNNGKIRDERIKSTIDTWCEKLMNCKDEQMKQKIKSILACILEVR